MTTSEDANTGEVLAAGPDPHRDNPRAVAAATAVLGLIIALALVIIGTIVGYGAARLDDRPPRLRPGQELIRYGNIWVVAECDDEGRRYVSSTGQVFVNAFTRRCQDQDPAATEGPNEGPFTPEPDPSITTTSRRERP